MAVRKLVRRKRDGFDLRFDDNERDLLGHLLGELRSLLIAENPASDPGVARLFPPAYPDDLLQNLDFERGAGNEIQLTDSMIRLMETLPFYGMKYEGRTYDTGSKIGFLMANVAYALERDDLAPAFRAELEAFLGSR